MKALTLTQPWASLVAIGAKQIETRSWRTDYRGPLAIHAAKGWTRGDRELVEDPYDIALCKPFVAALRPADYTTAADLPRSAIVAVAYLVGDEQMSASDATTMGFLRTLNTGRTFWALSDQERAFGDYSPGRWAWLLANVRRLPEPVPCKGALGLWNVPTDVMKAIEVQL